MVITPAVTLTVFSADVNVEIADLDEPGENIDGTDHDGPNSSALTCRSVASTVLISTAILLTLFTHN